MWLTLSGVHDRAPSLFTLINQGGITSLTDRSRMLLPGRGLSPYLLRFSRLEYRFLLLLLGVTAIEKIYMVMLVLPTGASYAACGTPGLNRRINTDGTKIPKGWAVENGRCIQKKITSYPPIIFGKDPYSNNFILWADLPDTGCASGKW